MGVRRVLTFSCSGETLVGSLDDAAGSTGRLIVTGGNEVRAGAHRGMALLAARLADAGVPVFRYDRRGCGDSTGVNAGFAGARDDLLAAAAAFRDAAPQVTRLVGFGNCDAATTLAWWGRDAGCDAVVLANPWVVAPVGDLPPGAAIRAHYLAQLRDLRVWGRVARRGLSLRKLVRGMRRAVAPTPPDGLTERAMHALNSWGESATVVLARGDGTAIAYADAARRAGVAVRTVTVETGSHSFARERDMAVVAGVIREVVDA